MVLSCSSTQAEQHTSDQQHMAPCLLRFYSSTACLSSPSSSMGQSGGEIGGHKRTQEDCQYRQMKCGLSSCPRPAINRQHSSETGGAHNCRTSGWSRCSCVCRSCSWLAPAKMKWRMFVSVWAPSCTTHKSCLQAR